MLTSSDIKQALHEAGLEVYRTEGQTVHVAERVRENLILDAGVRISTEPLAVTFLAEASKSQFPGEDDDALFERARALGHAALGRGFVEKATRVAPMEDPSHPTLVLDERYQIVFTKRVEGIEAAIAEVRFALTLSRQAER